MIHMCALTSQRTTRADKGKQRAVEPSSSADAAGGSSKSAATSTTSMSDAALAAHRSLLSTLLPSLTCQVCLLLMDHPYALAPCGHVVCHSCLVSWFTAEPGRPDLAAPAPIPVPAPVNVPIAVPPNAPRLPPAPLRYLGAPPPPPAGHNHLHKRKTCPHCRAVGRTRPAERPLDPPCPQTRPDPEGV